MGMLGKSPERAHFCKCFLVKGTYLLPLPVPLSILVYTHMDRKTEVNGAFQPRLRNPKKEQAALHSKS